MAFDISINHNNFRLLGTRDCIDNGPANGKIQLFGTTKPSPGDPPGDAPLVEIILAKPCGAIVANLLELELDDPGGNMIAITGEAVWARFLDGHGAWVQDGTVTDEAGDGDVKVEGTSGTDLFAGGYLVLATTALG